jgi:hypothetical protein
MRKYLYVKLNARHNTRAFFLRVESESDAFISGIEVDVDGDEVKPKGADERLRIIQPSELAFARPAVFNNTYAMLEVVRD